MDFFFNLMAIDDASLGMFKDKREIEIFGLFVCFKRHKTSVM